MICSCGTAETCRCFQSGFPEEYYAIRRIEHHEEIEEALPIENDRPKVKNLCNGKGKKSPKVKYTDTKIKKQVITKHRNKSNLSKVFRRGRNQ